MAGRFIDQAPLWLGSSRTARVLRKGDAALNGGPRRDGLVPACEMSEGAEVKPDDPRNMQPAKAGDVGDAEIRASDEFADSQPSIDHVGCVVRQLAEPPNWRPELLCLEELEPHTIAECRAQARGGEGEPDDHAPSARGIGWDKVPRLVRQVE